MKKIFILIPLLQISKNLQAQFIETVRTVRLGKAIGAYAVGMQVLQTQTGFDVEEFNKK